MSDPQNSTNNNSDNESIKFQFIKLVLEIGPLAVFFFVNSRYDLLTATAAFMVAITISLIASFILHRKIPTMPLISGVFVLVFGGLTLYLQDATFIKMKPTIINTFFSATLFAGLIFKFPTLEIVFGEAFKLTATGWRILTWRWCLFFLCLAIINEIVWRTQSDDFWVAFKVWGIMPLTIVFTMFQLPIIKNYSTDLEK